MNYEEQMMQNTLHQQAMANTPYQPPNHQANGNMIIMTNPEEELLRLEANFRGNIITADGNEVHKFDEKMNETGINQVIGMVRTIVNRVTFMSNIKTDQVQKFMEYFADTLAQVLMVNKHKFGITSDADRTAIFFESVMVCHIAILRGLEEGEKRFWKGTTMEVNYGGLGMQKKGGGFMEKVSLGKW